MAKTCHPTVSPLALSPPEHTTPTPLPAMQTTRSVAVAVLADKLEDRSKVVTSPVENKAGVLVRDLELGRSDEGCR